MVRETIIKMKRYLTEWEKIFACHTPDMELVSNSHKNLENATKENEQSKMNTRIRQAPL